MYGGEPHGEGGPGEEHAAIFDAGGVGEEFRLAGKGETQGLQAFFGDRAGDHGRRIGVRKQACGFLERVECGLGGFTRGLARDGCETVPENAELKALRELARGERGIDDFGAYARRIAKSDENLLHRIEMALERVPVKERLRSRVGAKLPLGLACGGRGVEAGGMLSEEMKGRFGGVARLYGMRALETFSRSRVVVVGIGGVGSWTVEALARSGIGKIRLVDLDEICITNVNRQLHAMDGQIGRQKTAAMAERVRAIHPECEIEVIEGFFTERSIEEVLGGEIAGVVDAIDSMKHKALLLAECKRRGLAVVTCGAAGGRRDATRISVRDLAFSGKDALLHQLRKNLRKHHGFAAVPMGSKPEPMGITAVFSDEPPVYPGADGEVSCAKPEGSDMRLSCETGYGTATHVTGTFGVVAAGAMLEVLAG